MTTLDLKFPIARAPADRERGGPILSWATGSNCERIERCESGGWLITLKDDTRYWVGDANVETVEDKIDRYSDALELPSYAEKAPGGFKCKECQRVCPTLHGLKTHYGSHRRE